MKFGRSVRVCSALLALVSLLFTQLALAGYACEVLESFQGTVSASSNAAEDPQGSCDGMDEVQPALCYAHCHPQTSFVDNIPSPALHAPSFDFIGTALVAVTLGPSIAVLPSVADLLARASSPPISVRNCCFRN